jgi:hypothetical protein
MEKITFSDIAIVACGTMSSELQFLENEGFLDTAQIYYTTPGLHQDIRELERQLVEKVKRAQQSSAKILVVYGGKFCYVNVDEPTRRINDVLTELGPGIVRIEATHCMDMLASQQERDRIAAEMADGLPVWWMTPGWIMFQKNVFKGWDKALANENFPRHTGGAIVLDGVGYMDVFMEEHPEDFLEYADWMGIPLLSYPITLDRFKQLLTNKAIELAAAA